MNNLFPFEDLDSRVQSLFSLILILKGAKIRGSVLPPLCGC